MEHCGIHIILGTVQMRGTVSGDHQAHWLWEGALVGGRSLAHLLCQLIDQPRTIAVAEEHEGTLLEHGLQLL